jgi:hypothetical protein
MRPIFSQEDGAFSYLSKTKYQDFAAWRGIILDSKLDK